MVYVYISHYLLRNVIQVHRIVYQLNLYVQIQLVRTPTGTIGLVSMSSGTVTRAACAKVSWSPMGPPSLAGLYNQLTGWWLQDAADGGLG